MKETIAKINEVVAALQADLAKAAEGNDSKGSRDHAQRRQACVCR